MNEAQIKLEARLIAIEYVIGKLAQLVYVKAGLSAEHVAILHGTIREGLKNETIPGVDAAQSDLFSAEIEDAVGRLLNEIEEIAGLANRRKA